MNNLLLDRLDECQISINDILLRLNKTAKNSTVIIYTSHLEGLGTKNSDFDIYVLGEALPEINYSVDYGYNKVQNLIIKGTLLDIEYWTVPIVKKLIDNSTNNSNNANLNLENLKLVHRLRVGEIISGFDIGLEIKSLIESSKLKSKLLELYKLQSNSFLQDAVAMYNAKELISSLNCARNAMEYAIAALNVKNGITNVKLKWVSKIFMNNNGYEKSIYDKYMKYQVFCNIQEDNIDCFLEGMLEFISDLLASIAMTETKTLI